MKYANVNTKQITDALPTQIGATWNPTLEQLQAAGWREVKSVGIPPEGCSVTAYDVVELSSSDCELTVLSYFDPVAAAAAARQTRLASITPELLFQANVFRTIMHTYFGPGSETNHDLTRLAVASYFNDRRTSGTITAQETSDFVALQDLFDVISAWTGDGTTWSFEWSLLDA